MLHVPAIITMELVNIIIIDLQMNKYDWGYYYDGNNSSIKGEGKIQRKQS